MAVRERCFEWIQLRIQSIRHNHSFTSVIFLLYR